MRHVIAVAAIASQVLLHTVMAAQAPPPGQAPAQPRYDGAIATAQVVLERLLSESRLPGLQVAVGIGGEIVWSQGFGYADLENRLGVTPSTKFRVGSLSKALTAASMMTLVEAGRLDLDADIRRYVPQFPDKGHAITARQLAGHLAGIRHYRDEEGIGYKTYSNVLDALEVSFFLEHPEDTLLGPARPALRGDYGFTAVLRGDSVAGSIELSESPRYPGSIRYGTGAPIPLLVVDTLHADTARIVGVGSQGLLNLWLVFTPEGFRGTWDWLAATVEIQGVRRRR